MKTLRLFSSDTPRWSRLLGAGYLVVAVALVVTSLYVLVVASWTVISFDQWRIYNDYFSKGLADGLLTPQNGHFPVIPGLLFLVDIQLFGAHNYFLNCLGVMLAVVSAVSWSWLVVRDRELTPLLQALCLGVVWISYFWLENRRVLGHGNESLHVYLLVNGFFLAWWVITTSASEKFCRGDLKTVLLVSLGCSIATFSYALGIVVWPVIVGLAICIGLSRRITVALSLIFFAHLAIYMRGFLGAGGEGLLREISLREVLADAATWLGSMPFHILAQVSVFERNTLLEVVSPLLGAIGILVALVAGVGMLHRRYRMSPLESWCAGVLIFGLGSSLMVAIARQSYFDFLPEQRVALRYLPWVCFFWAAALIVLACRVASLRRGQKLAVISWVGLVLLLTVGWVRTHTGKDLEFAKYRLEHAAVGLGLGLEHDKGVQRLFPEPAIVYRVAEQLDERDLAMFSWPVSDQIGKPFNDFYREVGSVAGEAREPRCEVFPSKHGKAASVWGILTSPTPGFTDFVIVDRAGFIRGGGIIRGSGHYLARRLGLLAWMESRYLGYVANYTPEASDRLFAVKMSSREASFLLTLPSFCQGADDQGGGENS